MSKDKIAELIADIQKSGALGRSSVYPRLLNYLVEKSSTGQSCSEVDLAEKVFFKNDSFDQTTDSSVRVYVHNLRKKLQLYYAGKGQKDTYRIHIPKGEYRVEIVDAEGYSRLLGDDAETPRGRRALPSETGLHRKKYSVWAGLAVLCSLILVITFSVYLAQRPDQIEFTDEQLAFWGGVLSDQKPVRILLDNTTGRFGIQSRSVSALESGESSRDSQGQQAEVPDLLIRLVAMLEGVSRPVEIGYLSELTSEQITGKSHIIYTDHIDGIVKLAEIFQGVDQLEPQDLASRLLAKQADIARSSHLSAGDPRATDYGMIFRERLQMPGSEPFEFIVLSGNGFTGQSAVLQIAQSQRVLTEMQLTEAEALSGGLSALFQVTASDGFQPERVLLSSETL